MVAIVFLIGLMSCGSSSRSDPHQLDCDSGFTYLSDRCGICPAPNMQHPGEASDPTQKGYATDRDQFKSLSLAKPPPVYFILLFSFKHLTLAPPSYLPYHWLLWGCTIHDSCCPQLLFRPVSSREPGLKHDQVADWV